MITITENPTKYELSEGCVLYTEDGIEFRQVDTSTGHLLSITQVVGKAREGFLSLATWGPAPEGAWFENAKGITLGS